MTELDADGNVDAVQDGCHSHQGEVRHDAGHDGENAPLHQQQKEDFRPRRAAQQVDLVLPGILPNPTVEKGENAQCRQKRNAKEQRLHLLICFCPRLGLRAASHQMNIAIGEVSGNLLDDGGIASGKGFLHVQHNRIRNVAVCKKVR